MYTGHNNDIKGDFSFMEDLLPENITAFHMDSYNNEHGKRFQGAGNQHITWTIWF